MKLKGNIIAITNSLKTSCLKSILKQLVIRLFLFLLIQIREDGCDTVKSGDTGEFLLVNIFNVLHSVEKAIIQKKIILN